MDPFPNNHAQLVLPRPLALGDGGLGALDGFFDVETVEVDGSRWGLFVVLYGAGGTARSGARQGEAGRGRAEEATR